MVKNLPAMQEIQIWSLGQEDTLEKEMATHSSMLAWKNPMDWGVWWAMVLGVSKSRDMAKVIEYVPLFHLESFGGIYKGNGWMASLIQWMCVWVNSGSWWWTGRPGVLRFMGSQRVGHDWATELNKGSALSSSLPSSLFLSIQTKQHPSKTIS